MIKKKQKKCVNVESRDSDDQDTLMNTSVFTHYEVFTAGVAFPFVCPQRAFSLMC